MFDIENSTIVCIDIQEKLVNMLKNSDEIRKNTEKIMKTASILNIDTIITEQYPKGLGSTIEEIKSIKDFKTIEKTTFSAQKTEEFKNITKNKNIIIFGIETHICVFQSAIDLIEEGHNVFIISNCSSSRNKKEHKTALSLLKQKGAYIMTLEMVLFNLLKSSKHPNFKEIQALIK